MMLPHDRYRAYLETLTPETLVSIGDHVSDDVRFRDPFNDVRGVANLRQIFEHMFQTVGQVRFDIHHCLADGNTCLMQWTFHARLRQKPWSFEGSSRITFDGTGKVIEHIDYWDAARDLYEHFPLIGWLLSRIRRKIGKASEAH